MRLVLFFFFSSRRRHTRWTGDWSSDVCSSDLGLNRDALEVHVEARPAGHAMDVGVERLARHFLELGPRELERVLDLAPDLEVPRLEIDARHGAVVQDWPLLSEVLAGRDALLLLVADSGAAAQKARHAPRVFIRAWCATASTSRCRSGRSRCRSVPRRHAARPVPPSAAGRPVPDWCKPPAASPDTRRRRPGHSGPVRRGTPKLAAWPIHSRAGRTR